MGSPSSYGCGDFDEGSEKNFICEKSGAPAHKNSKYFTEK